MKLLFLSLALLLAGCSTVKTAGIKLFYKKASFPESQITRNLCYIPGSAHPKHRLDFYRPSGTNWPLLVFIYGGAWTEGDKDYKFGKADVYGNIGRFYASRGIAAAIINYRLQPEASWREQAQDVAAAIAFARQRAAQEGGDASRLYVMGHSAGAYFADLTAANPEYLRPHGLSPSDIRGVISVSGAGLDLSDARTYELGQSPKYFKARFGGSSEDNSWMTKASPVAYLSSNSPPFLILYAQGEKKAMHRQSQRLHEVLEEKHVRSRLTMVPGESHARIVLTLSRDDKKAAQEALAFINNQL